MKNNIVVILSPLVRVTDDDVQAGFVTFELFCCSDFVVLYYIIDWDHEEPRVVIPKIRENLERLVNIKYNMMKSSTFKDVLYEKTSRGPKSESTTLIESKS